jgi:localization factor PodJL
MRAELPWNVAGIPPEAREAARAAARREGLSVGEWLTRRILRSFSGMDEDAGMAFESRGQSGAPLDSWGMPQSSSSRRDTEDMMARVGRSETESNEAWRRIEDQMRGLSRRIDSSERSHSESNRVLSRTAQEMNISTREQAQAFDQMGLNVMALNERLERLERSAVHDGIKEAVKALHQGLSRLADQITATANNSAGQVVQLTSSLEQLANRVGQARVDSENSDKALDQRIDATEMAVDARLKAVEQAAQNAGRGLDQRFETAEKAMEGRLAAVEKTAQFNTNALDHALEKIETSANQRATDQVENQRRSAQHEESLNRLEDSIARLEMRLPDAEFERRLDNIEHSVSGMADRLEKYDPTQRFDATMQAMAHRLEELEKDHNDLLAELRTRVLRPVEPPAYEAPPRPEPPRAEPPRPEPQRYEPPPQSAFEVPPLAGPPPFDSPAYETPVDAFATPHGFAFDAPSEHDADPFAPPPDFADVFADVPEPENFLAQARRSARAAAEKAESERHGRFAGLFQKAPHADAEKPKSRYVVPLSLALLVVAVGAAAVLLSQRAKTPEQLPAQPPAQLQVTHPAAPALPSATAPTPPPKANQTPFVVAPQSAAPSPGAAKTVATAAPRAPERLAPPPAQHQTFPAPVQPVPPQANKPSQASTARPAAPAADKVMQLANAGNPTALTILGLRALDKQPANLPDAIRFLTQAAEKGQPVAQYRLGTLYERGQGVATDPAKAARWYELSANQGNRKAMHNLAVSYAAGAGGKKNMAEAGRWFGKAAALGLSDSQFNLAVLYERGDGVPQSLLDAYKWYSIAATSGDSESKQRMGVLATQLSDADKATANKSAATFHAAPLNRSANVPPEPADLG